MKKQSMDGNTAAAYVSYAFTQVAAIYPITPSSPMAESVDEWASRGKKNIFGETVKVHELQSEAGASGTVHGSLKAGALTSTYTASQGLLLMIPNMYKIAGELLPTVFHIASRAIAANALNIFGDHSDSMAIRQTGFAMLFESSVQEVMDLATVAHLATIESSVPFASIFDGFRTSHEIQKIEVFDDEEFKSMINMEKVQEFRDRAMTPERPTTSGTNENPDIYFQQRETVNAHYNDVIEATKKYMKKVNELRGTNYDLVNYYGAEDAEEVIVLMGSGASTAIQVADYLNERGRKVGVLNIHLYRPFPVETFLEKMPKTVKSVAVLDRTKEPGSGGEPLLLDVQSALYDSELNPTVIGGRYGIGSKDVLPNQMVAVFDELKKPYADQKKRFTVGIKDDVTNMSLELGEPIDPTPKSTFQAMFWGLGSDGTVGANKSAIKIIGNNTDKYVQGYFSYDSKKSGGLTVSHLRFGDEPITSSYLINNADLVACHAPSYIGKFDLLAGLKKGGTFLLNAHWGETAEELEEYLPASMRRYIAQNDINFYVINASKIAKKVGLGGRINTVMQVAFFAVSNIIDIDDAIKLLKDGAQKAYGHKSQKIVEMNWKAIDSAYAELKKVEVPESWATAEEDSFGMKDGMTEIEQLGNVARFLDEDQKEQMREYKKHSFIKVGSSKYISNVLIPVNRQKGDSVSVGDLVENGVTSGDMPAGTTSLEKRGVAEMVPVWDPERCIACNECSFVCPHAAIRPFLADEEEMKDAPEGYITRDVTGFDGLKYRIQVSIDDCTGCGLCVDACPAPKKALHFGLYENEKEQAINWAFAMTLRHKTNPVKKETVRGSQFEQPLLEFSGACAGCGETPYVKLITQLFGDRMMVANATGCSSIWGAAFPVSPYAVNEKGYGPVWCNSLFEDNAEFGYGQKVAVEVRRDELKTLVEKALEEGVSGELKEAFEDWLANFKEKKNTRERAEHVKELLANELKTSDSETLKAIDKNKHLFVLPSNWIFGGDGWSYDIGYGGLDHVMASGEDINVIVFDTEVYSNTGGQSSKATPAAAIAKFAAGGKRAPKKDLGKLFIDYNNVYVAQIAEGMSSTQALNAIKEAEAYNGPSIIIAYAPCINHGIKGGLANTLKSSYGAVESGYWQIYRYNPDRAAEGKNPMILDYKKPDFSKMKDYMLSQTRYSSLTKVDPENADCLFDKSIEDAKRRFFTYARLAGQEEQIREKLSKLYG